MTSILLLLLLLLVLVLDLVVAFLLQGLATGKC